MFRISPKKAPVVSGISDIHREKLCLRNMDDCTRVVDFSEFSNFFRFCSTKLFPRSLYIPYSRYSLLLFNCYTKFEYILQILLKSLAIYRGLTNNMAEVYLRTLLTTAVFRASSNRHAVIRLKQHFCHLNLSIPTVL
jgi:hypothetical protein